MRIGFACELTPAKTFIPIIEKLRKMEKNNELNWDKLEIIALTHGDGAEKLISPYSDETHHIGAGRSSRNEGKIGKFYLVAKDIIEAIKSMKNVDLLLSCGNAGDVRKSVIAAYFLRIPVIHIEQDIYNPIETIALTNLVTLPLEKYESYIQREYKIKNVKVIGGYPMVRYIDNFIKNSLKSKKEVENLYFKNNTINEYIFLVLGGDLKKESISNLINALIKYNFPIVIAPYRFNKNLVEEIVQKANEVKVVILDNYVDIISLIKYCKVLIYGAGMGLTIEAGILKKPTIKIDGFHKLQGSVDLAKHLNIPVIKMEDFPENIGNLNKITGDLIKDSDIAIENIINIIKNYKNYSKKGGFSSYLSIIKKGKCK
jgi:UDP-N-acetylglucosamine:LPS N-acetylglucosamine transferase